MIPLTLAVIAYVAALLILVSGLFYGLNRTTCGTPVNVRVFWICLTIGAFCVVTAPLFGTWRPSLGETLVLVGVATFVVFERRNRKEWCLWHPN